MTKLFISHAGHDKPLVEAVVDLLEAGVGVPLRSIFCSALKEQNIKPGEYFVQSIHSNLDNSTCVLALISEAYYASAFCMCELGGAWLQSKSLLPVVIPPIGESNLKAVLGGLQVSKIGNDEDLDLLRDELVKRLGIEGHPTPRWNRKRKAFLDALPGLLEKIRFTGPVERATYEKLEKAYKEYEREYEARVKEIEHLQIVIADLKKVKDAKEVAKVVRQHLTSPEQFGHLVAAAATALERLPHAVREALYYRSGGTTTLRSERTGRTSANRWSMGSSKNSRMGMVSGQMITIRKCAKPYQPSMTCLVGWKRDQRISTSGTRLRIKVHNWT